MTKHMSETHSLRGGGLNRELVVFVPMGEFREARVAISIVEHDPVDPVGPATMREPTVPEMDGVSTALMMRAYNHETAEG